MIFWIDFELFTLFLLQLNLETLSKNTKSGFYPNKTATLEDIHLIHLKLHYERKNDYS